MTDEIAHIMRIFGEFRYQRLSKLQNRLLKAGLEKQRSITGAYWDIFRFWSLTECVPHSNFILALANSSRWKLSSRELIVLDEQQERFLLPYRKTEDFFAFASLLGIESLYGYATLAFFIRPTYYDFENLSPPVQIMNAADADDCEFEFLEEYHQYTKDNNSLWWGRGFLHALTLDLQQTPPIMKFTYLDA